MKITRIDRATAAFLNQELTKAVQCIAAQYGLEVKTGGTRFGSGSAEVKVTFITPAGKALQTEVASVVLGLPETLIGQTFRHKTKTFTITGLNPNAPKYCIELKDQNGRGFKCSKDQARAMGVKF